MPATIRKMRPEDEDAAIEVLAQWNMAPLAPSEQTPEPERASLDVACSFVAVIGGRIVGVCSYIIHSATRAETASLAVEPESRGKGVGNRLQRARLREMKERGIETVTTETDRDDTIRWYVENFGYSVRGTNKKKHAFSRSDVDHWTVLELDLSNYECE